MARARRYLRSLPFLLPAAACAVPERDNRFDPSRAPNVVLSVGRGTAESNEPVLEGRRSDPLVIRLEGSKDPQGDRLTADVTRHDARTDAEIASSEHCPQRIPDHFIGTFAWEEDEDPYDPEDVLVWNAHPDLCFEPGTDGARIPLRLHADVRDSHGYRAVGELAFIMRNSAPELTAPPILWRDPLLDTPVVLRIAETAERDGDPVTFEWEFLSGPIDLSALDRTTAEPELDLELAARGAYRPGASYRFRVTPHDAWEAGVPGVAEVVLSPAIWMGAGDNLSLVDSRWSETDRVWIGGAPAALTDVPEIAAGRDGIWVMRNGSATVTSVRRDFTAATLALPGGYVHRQVLGSDPPSGVAWSVGQNGGQFRVLTLTTAGISTEDVITAAAADDAAFAGRLDAASTFWIAGSRYATRSIPGGTLEQFPLSGTCVEYDSVFDGAVAGDGSVWLLGSSSGQPSLVRVTEDGVEASCFHFAADPGDYALAVAWTPGATGAGELLVGYRDRAVEVVDPETGSFSAGPDVLVDVRGLRYDPGRDRVFATGPEATSTWAVGEYVEPLASSNVGNGLGLDSPGDTFAIDANGDAWFVFAYPAIPGRIVRLPADLDVVRAKHEGGRIDPDTIAATDPATGRVWFARPSPDLNGTEAVEWDERGLTGATVTLPDGVLDMVFDPGRDAREPAFWVLAMPPGGTTYEVSRVPVAGGPANPVFDVAGVAALAERPTAPALDPVNGHLWASISAGAFSGAMRFRHDGTQDGHVPGWPTNMSFDFAPRPRAAFDPVTGRYWTFNNSGALEYFYWADGTSRAYFPGNALDVCPDGGGFPYAPSAIHLDRGAQEIVLVCSEYVPDENASYLADLRRYSMTPLAFRAAIGGVTTSIDDVGAGTSIDGTILVPDRFASTLRFYDRNHTANRREHVEKTLRSSVIH